MLRLVSSLSPCSFRPALVLSLMSSLSNSANGRLIETVTLPKNIKTKMKNEFLRHTLSTIAYRFQKAMKKAEMDFGDFTLGKESRTPNEIINHMYHVLNSTRIFIVEERILKELPEKLNLKLEIDRFNFELKNIDYVLVDNDLGINYSKRLLQGPLSDILTHIGQISMLSRLYGNPITGEDYSCAGAHLGIAVVDLSDSIGHRTPPSPRGAVR